MSTKLYDPAKHVVTWGPYLISGFGQGTFIKGARDEQAMQKKVGVDGEVVRSRNKNRGGTVEITLLQSSASNDIFSSAAQADELTGTGVFPLLVQDLLGTTVMFAQNAWLQKPADNERAKEAGENTWILDCDKLDMLVGGSLQGP